MLTKDTKTIKECRQALEDLFPKERTRSFSKDLDRYIDLFFYEKPVTLLPSHAAVLEKAGIVRLEGDKWIANVMVFPFRRKYIVTDFLFSLYRKTDEGRFVTGVDDVWLMYPYETLRFIEKLDKNKGQIALDIASGSGAISLFLAEYFDQVISADINPKAVSYARFNVVLNDLEDRIVNLPSDVFSCLGGYKFDYICWNGPTVPFPEVTEAYPIYAYGGFDGTQFTRKFLDNVFTYVNKPYKIKWLDGGLGDSHSSASEYYIKNNFPHLPVRITIEFLNKRRGVPRKEYEVLFRKYCLGRFEIYQKDRREAVKHWHDKLKADSLSHVYMSYISIEPHPHFEIVYKDSPQTLFGPRQLYGFEWHFVSRRYIRSYLLRNNTKATSS